MPNAQKANPAGGPGFANAQTNGDGLRGHFMSGADAVSTFRDAMQAAGIEPPDKIITDGTIHRFSTNGKRASKNGWYVMHLDGVPAGAFGDWRTGANETWTAIAADKLSQTDREAQRRRLDEIKQQRDAEQAQRQKEAQAKAQAIWEAATPAPADHPYLARKGIQPHGVRTYKESLVIPVGDLNGVLHSVQFIASDGEKRFLTGGRIAGCMFVIGDLEQAQTIATCEGFATGATIRQESGHAIACAFTAGNLEPVAKAIRHRRLDAKLIIAADDDYRTEGNPGLTKATAAARAAGALLAVPDFGADRPEGATDFNDLELHRRGAVAECIADAGAPRGTAPAKKEPQRPKLVVVSAHDLLVLDLPPRDKLLSPWLESQSLCMVHAWRGIGKTHFALGVAYALASGGEFLGWRALAPVPTLYVDGEMPGPALRDRLARIATSNDAEPATGFLLFITPDLQPDGVMPNLATHEGQQAIESVLGNARVIVIDNLSCLVRGGKENEADSWQPVADWALRMRATGRSVLFIHHSGKGGQQRGTSKREDLLDVVIALQRPKDYVPDQGARFVVLFEKARSLFGQNVEPFEAALDTDEHGRQVWTLTTADDATDERVIELAELGMPQAEIARELGVNRSTVLRKLRKAEEEGRYRPRSARTDKGKRAAGGASYGHG